MISDLLFVLLIPMLFLSGIFWMFYSLEKRSKERRAKTKNQV